MNRFRDIEFPFSALLLLSVLWTQKPNIPFDQTRRIQSQSFALIGSYTSGTQIYRCKHYLQIGMLLIASICHVMIAQRISCIQTFNVFIEVSLNGYFMNCKSGDNYSSRLVAELFFYTLRIRFRSCQTSMSPNTRIQTVNGDSCHLCLFENTNQSCKFSYVYYNFHKAACDRGHYSQAVILQQCINWDLSDSLL